MEKRLDAISRATGTYAASTSESSTHPECRMLLKLAPDRFEILHTLMEYRTGSASGLYPAVFAGNAE